MTAVRPPVVAGVDGGPATRHVARAAADRAHRELLPLELVTAVEGAHDAGRAHDGPWQRALAHLDALRRDLAEYVPTTPVRTIVRAGPAAEVLREESTGAALLVVGRGGVPGVLGPVVRELLRTARCPLLLVPRQAAGGGDVVAGVDGTDGTTSVLAAAALEAGTRGAPLRMVHTWGRRAGVADPSSPAAVVPPVAEAVVDAERRFVEDRAGRVRGGWPTVPVTVDVRAGDPASVLVDLSRGAGLVVLGRAGDASGRAVVDAVATGARCPVLLVPPAGRRPAGPAAGIPAPRDRPVPAPRRPTPGRT
ncbi:universal stress protein [Geodermatophilus sp. SYSU D00710]